MQLITGGDRLQVLKVLSDIWKNGGIIERDKTDGRLELKNHKNIPPEVLKAAEPIFDQIEEWFKSWENESQINVAMRKIIHLFCGWQANDKLNEWLTAEIDYLLKFDEWMKMLAHNGWKDIYDDFRQYQTDESNKLAQEIYERAVAYVKKGA